MEEVRLDRWLWAARCFKTRSQATEACNAGHAKIDGVSIKPGRKIRPGVTVEVVTAGGQRVLEVVALGDRRGSATVAQTLYVDHTPPPPPKEEGLNAVPTRERGAGRPSKRERRILERLKRG